MYAKSVPKPQSSCLDLSRSIAHFRTATRSPERNSKSGRTLKVAMQKKYRDEIKLKAVSDVDPRRKFNSKREADSHYIKAVKTRDYKSHQFDAKCAKI